MITEESGGTARREPVECCSFIREHHHDILACWQQRVRALPVARKLDHPELIDSIPEVLDMIADTAESLVAGVHEHVDVDALELHAIDRLEQEYDLPALVIELGILRNSIIETMEVASHRLSGPELRALDASVDLAVAATTDKYAKARERTIHTLDRIANAALESQGLDDLVERLLEILVQASGSIHEATILVPDGQVLRIRASVGLDETVEERVSVPIGEGFAGTIAATRAPLELRDATNDPRILRPALRRAGVRALYGIPLIASDQLVAVIHMGSLTVHEFSPDDKRLFRAVATRTTEAIYQQVLRETAERSAAELLQRERELRALVTEERFLDEATKVLNRSLDYSQTLQEISQLAVPDLADWCVVDLVDGEDLRRVAIANPDPARVGMAREWAQLYPTKLDDMPTVAKVIRTGTAQMVTEIRDEMLVAVSRSPEHLAALRALGLKSLIVAPLRARGRTLGALTLATSKQERRFDKRDLGVAIELGLRAGIAVDNARLYMESQQALGERCMAVRARDEVLAIVTHDLRNPLNVISMSAEEALESAGADTKKSLEMIQRSVERMTRMIDELLDMATVQAGGVTLALKFEPADRLITDVIEAHAANAERAGLRIVRDCEQPSLQIWCDRDRIERVFGNLIGNSIKYCKPGDVIVVRCRVEDGKVRFSVADNGPGIPVDQLPHVFEPFWTANRAGKKGIGLGLYIARGIVEAHGGELRVESEPSCGTEFIFTLPLMNVR